MSHLTIVPEKRLFWFLKEGVRFDLSDPAVLDMYVQQILTYGRTQDVRDLIKTTGRERLSESLKRIQRFLPREVREFWEDFVGNR